MISTADSLAISYSPTVGRIGLEPADWRIPWHVAYCRPRQEKALARDLLQLGAPYFLPMVERVTASRGRRRSSMCPLFPSYVFFGAEEHERVAALRTNRILSFLPTDAAEQQVLKDELAALEACLLTAPERVELYNHLVTGQRVRVTCGAMRDWEGVVQDATRPHRVAVLISMMGGGVLVDVHADMLAAH